MDEGAEELVFYLGSDGVHVNAGLGEKLSCILDVVDPRRLDRSILESSTRQLGDVLVVFERACDTANPEQHAFAYSLRHTAAHDHIGDCEPSAGLQNPERFTQDAIFVG